MMRAQNLRQHRHGLFAAVFLLSGDENDVFAFAGAVTTGISQPLRAFGNRVSKQNRLGRFDVIMVNGIEVAERAVLTRTSPSPPDQKHR